MIEESIRDFLVSKSDIIAYVNTRIYWTDSPQDTVYPKVVFKVMSRPLVDYRITDEWQRWRFWVFAEDKFDVDTISLKIEGYLHNAYGAIEGDYFDSITRIDESPIEFRAEDKVYYKWLEFRVIYH